MFIVPYSGRVRTPVIQSCFSVSALEQSQRGILAYAVTNVYFMQPAVVVKDATGENYFLSIFV